MTIEDKQLLLKDLSARLSHGVKVCIKLPNHQEHIFEEYVGDLKELTRYGGYLVNSKGIDYRSFDLDIKPYLRPMSSMSIEEICKIRNIIGDEFSYENGTLTLNTEDVIRIPIYKMSNLLQFMCQRHLDFNNLIPMGLAIEVTKENNPYKEIEL